MQHGAGKLQPAATDGINVHVVILGRNVGTAVIDHTNRNRTGGGQPLDLTTVGIVKTMNLASDVIDEICQAAASNRNSANSNIRSPADGIGPNRSRSSARTSSISVALLILAIRRYRSILCLRSGT